MPPARRRRRRAAAAPPPSCAAAEWAGRRGKDFELTLTGPAGGTWRAGANGPSWTLDAIDFCRAISRRPASLTLDELMNAEVPY